VPVSRWGKDGGRFPISKSDKPSYWKKKTVRSTEEGWGHGKRGVKWRRIPEYEQWQEDRDLGRDGRRKGLIPMNDHERGGEMCSRLAVHTIAKKGDLGRKAQAGF